MFQNQFFLVFLLLMTVFSKQLILSKENERFILKLNIANLKINLKPILSLQNNQNTWIKSEQCKYCRPIKSQTNTQNNPHIEILQEKLYDCSQSCFDKSEEQYGLKCVQTNKKCQILNQNAQINLGTNILKGKQIKLKGETQNNHEKFDELKILLVQRIFLHQFLSKETPSTDESKENQPYFLNQIGQYSIWGSGSLFDNSVVTKNTKNQILVYNGTKQNELEKQLLDTPPIHIEFEEAVTKFTLSQIKLSEKITLNHPQKETNDYQLPILPTQKGFLTLQTEYLLLPKKQYQKLISSLIQTYFSEEGNHCYLKDSKISCEKSINLDKVQYLEFQLILNGVSVGFPMTILLKNCKSKSCDLRISTSSNDSIFSIGTFLLEIFAVEFVEDTENIKLHRLDNQWNQFYSKNQKHHKENFNIFWWMGASVFYIFYYVLKVLFYLALFSLFINCLYHWRKIAQWTGKILQRIKRRNQSRQGGQLFEEDQDLQTRDTSKLIKRLKNRRNKVFVEDQPSLNDQITTQESN